MSGRFTDEQIKAIDSRGKNLLVSAAAGSGKTSVLIERAAGLIIGTNGEPVDIDRLLVVTFTNAAAAEMKSRLRKKLAGLIEQDKDNAMYQRQLALINRANISTFDSLCQTIVRENFMLLDIDPAFKVGDNVELSILKQQALSEVFKELYESDGGFLALAETMCENADDTPLKEIVLSVYEFIQADREPDKWLFEKAEDYNIPALNSHCARLAFEFSKCKIIQAVSALKEAARIAALPDGPAHYAEVLEKDLNMAMSLYEARDYEHMSELFILSFSELRRGSSGGNTELREQAKKNRDIAKAALIDVYNRFFFKSPQKMEQDMAGTYELLKTLSETVLMFSKRFMDLKNKRRILSFSDIKLLCYKVLVNSGQYTQTALEYQKRFLHVMVDEYQDTNDVEDGILDALAGCGTGAYNRFMVGDVKQSIYRFRRSNPALFIHKSEKYALDGETSELITLDKNFRSREYILNAINYIFSQIMTAKAAEIEYDGKAALIAGADFGTFTHDSVDICLVETDKRLIRETDADDGEDELKALEIEAGIIADKIYEMVCIEKMPVVGASGTRPVTFKDIAVLMRTGKKKGGIVADILASKGIPAFAEGKAGYFELTEISEMYALLQIIDNPLQDVPFMTVLLSEMYRFTAEELLIIRKISDKGVFYDALVEYIAANNNELSEKASQFLDKLLDYRKKASLLTISELLAFLYDDTKYFVLAGAMENGRLRQLNLQSLAKRAADFQGSSYETLFHFVRYMDKLRLSNALGAPNSVEDGADVVNIMTIHKSKGLEFPVVFVASCGSKFNMRDLNEKIILHQSLGYGAVYIDSKKRTKSDTLQRSVVKQALKNEFLAEEMRLLYVAVTRARERLIITGGVGASVARATEKWLHISREKTVQLSSYNILSANCYLDWIMPSVFRSPSAAGFLTETADGSTFSDLKTESEKWNCNNTDSARFTISVTKRSESVAVKKEGTTLTEEKFNDKIDTALKINIDKFINWKYNYIGTTKAPVKISISEIKMQYQKIISGDTDVLTDSEDAVFQSPLFMHEKRGLTAAEKGTALHSVMANLDVRTVRTADDLSKLLDGLLKRNIIDRAEYECININDILLFLDSDIAARMAASKNVRREVPFVIGLTPEEAYIAGAEDVTLVHGIIDCFFEEAGEITIVDYKTDNFSNEFEIARKYEIQLDIYRKAVEKITQKPVTQCCLYMMRYGICLEV